MGPRDKSAPNLLLYGFLAVSVGIHALLLVRMHGVGSYQPVRQHPIGLEMRVIPRSAEKTISEPIRGSRITTKDEKPVEKQSVSAVRPRHRAKLRAAKPAATMAKPPEIPDTPASGPPVTASEVSAVPEENKAASLKFGETSTKTVTPVVAVPSPEDSRAAYYKGVLAEIESRKKYPYAARKLQVEGRAKVRFVIEPDGTAREVEIAENSGNRLLDKAALAAVTASSPFPKPPPEIFKTSLPLEVEIIFLLNSAHP